MQETSQLSLSDIRAYDFLSLPVVLFERETLNILASNSAAQAWLGYDAQSLHALTIADICPAAEQPHIAAQVQTFDATHTDAGRWTVCTRSGDRYTVAFDWRNVWFEGVEAVVASVREQTKLEPGPSEHLTEGAQSFHLAPPPLPESFTQFIKALPERVLVLTPDAHVIVAATDAYARAMMMPRTAFLGRPIAEIFPECLSARMAGKVYNLLDSLQRVAALGVTDVMNIQRLKIRNPVGTFEERLWFMENTPVFDQSGQLIYIIHQAKDMTEVMFDEGADAGSTEGQAARAQVRARQVADARTTMLGLQERAARLRTAETLLGIGSWEYDIQQGKLFWSKRVCEIYGVPQDQTSPSFDEYIEMVHPDDQKQMLANYRHVVESEAPVLVFHHRIKRRDGKIAHIRGVGARQLNKGRPFFIGHVQDVTPYKEAEDRLRDAARLQKLAGDIARLGCWRVDLEPDRVTWSPETAAIHDEPEDVNISLEDATGYYVPEHRERIVACFTKCFQYGQPFDEVLQIMTAKGRRIWVRAIGEPARDDAGKVIAVEGAFQDVSELVAAQDASDDLSRRLRQTLESISDAFFLLDDQWRFSFMNRQAEELLQRTRDHLLHKNIWQEFPEAVGSAFDTEYNRAVTEGCAVQFKEFNSALQKWFEVDAYPTPEGLAVYFRDVTEQRAKEEQLRLLESAVSRQNDILVITEAQPVDSAGWPKVVFVNDAFEKRTGFSRAEAIRHTASILRGPETQPAELERIRQAIESARPVRAELIFHTKAGEEFWLELDIMPLADAAGALTHWVAIGRDITERKRSQQSIRLNEERFRLIAKATGNAVWEWDIVNGSQWWSEGLSEVFGHQPVPKNTVPTVWRDHVHPEDIARVDVALGRLLSGEQSSLREQYRVRRADGSWAKVEDRAFVLRDSEGSVKRVLGSMSDITDRVQLEERLRQSQKMEAVGQLTGGVAHDFNNLLTVILGSAEILSDELESHPHLQKLANLTVSAAESGGELTNRLLAFSRKQALDPVILDVGDLIQGMDNLLKRTLPESISVKSVSMDGLWRVEVDRGQLESALLNLAINARDAMPDGGCLTIEVSNTILDEGSVASELHLEAGEYVGIVITDTGEGMEKETLARIFEPFFTTKQVGKGTGLGLSMVYGFVKQSGGHILVYSEPGEGTCVKLYFPRTHACAESIVADRPHQPNTGQAETILVVEDDGLVRDYVVTQLGKLGYRVYDAPNGQDALNILNQVPDIDLLFTDIVMPGGMSGQALASAAHAIKPKLKILFTSGYTENAILHNGKLGPGVELLSKPYRRDELAAKLRKVMDNDQSY